MKYITVCFAALMLLSGCNTRVHTIRFDGTKEVSGDKIALKEINPDLPASWDGYSYVVIEYMISSAQRFQLGFTTDCGYNELRVMSYVPNAWNRLAIPMEYFTMPPAPAADLAATNNHARYTGWINLGGDRYPMEGVDSVGFRMRRAIGDVTLQIRNITLSKEDPGDLYLGTVPAVDAFGQSNLVDYPEKIRSLAQLREDWNEEENISYDAGRYGYSRFGGYLQSRTTGTGFFRVEKSDGIWWLVDPDGYRFLSVGVDCVDISGGGNVRAYDMRKEMFGYIPSSDTLAILGTDECSFGLLNVYRRYGDSYREKALDMTIRRMDRWGINTVANWSSDIVKESGRKAFLQPLYDLGQRSDLMGLCDVYDPETVKEIETSVAAQVSPYKGNPWLIGYFIGNEPAWLNQEDRLCGLVLDGIDRPLKKALVDFLSKNGDTPQTRKAFVHDAFRTYLQLTASILKKYDPDHLNLGIRFGDPQTLPDDILEMCSVFDVFSFNCYSLRPDAGMMDRIMALTGRPMMIGEYHFGTVDRGYAQSLWQVENQQQRGVAYRYYTENAYSHPGLVGTAYFQWSDQDLTGRFDGENYNCGLIDVTDRPYAEQTEAMSRTAELLFDIHSGKAVPYSEIPRNCRGHELIPDLWNE